MTNSKKPKIVVFDIEILNDTKGLHDFAWRAYPGASMGANQSLIISFGYKLHGEKKARSINVWDKKFAKNNLKGKIKEDGKLVDVMFYCDKLLCQEIYRIMADADAVVSFYGKKFDIKHIDARLIHHGLPALPNYKGNHIDIHQVVKSRLKMSHKRLNDVAKFVGCEAKIDTGGYSLWDAVFKGTKKAQKKMSDYCAQDVDVLDQVFDKLKGICPNLPTNWLYDGLDNELRCPHCGSYHFESKGWRTTKTGKYRRYICKECGTYFHGNKYDAKPRVD
jgi:DNA polymerase elongation subunit (family B)